MMSRKISIIGAGNMGEALIRGILATELFPDTDIMASEPREKRRREIARQLRIKVTADNKEAVRFAETVILSVKPQEARTVTEEIRSEIRESQLLISVMAGISTSWLEKQFMKKIPVVRVMPNTPALIRAGVAAISQGSFVRKEHLKEAEKIMGAVGRVLRLPEEMMNAVTAVSGSGPAYLYFFIEALSEAARDLGIEEKLARDLARETVIGSVKLLDETGEDPAILRKKVTSPGGTTEAAIRVFREKGFADLLKEAVKAACQRSRELEEEV